jgi:hypothetical protein
VQDRVIRGRGIQERADAVALEPGQPLIGSGLDNTTTRSTRYHLATFLSAGTCFLLDGALSVKDGEIVILGAHGLPGLIVALVLGPDCSPFDVEGMTRGLRGEDKSPQGETVRRCGRHGIRPCFCAELVTGQNGHAR